MTPRTEPGMDSDRAPARLGPVRKQPCRTEGVDAPRGQGARWEHVRRHVTDERRRDRGCSGGRMQWLFPDGPLVALDVARPARRAPGGPRGGLGDPRAGRCPVGYHRGRLGPLRRRGAGLVGADRRDRPRGAGGGSGGGPRIPPGGPGGGPRGGRRSLRGARGERRTRGAHAGDGDHHRAHRPRPALRPGLARGHVRDVDLDARPDRPPGGPMVVGAGDHPGHPIPHHPGGRGHRRGPRAPAGAVGRPRRGGAGPLHPAAGDGGRVADGARRRRRATVGMAPRGGRPRRR